MIKALLTIAFLSTNAMAETQVLVWEDASGLKTMMNCENVMSSDATKTSDVTSEVLEITSAPRQESFPLEGTFWQAEQDADGFKTVRCYDAQVPQDYIMYSVQRPEVNGVVAHIGVPPQQKLLFKFVNRHSPEDAEVAARSAGSAARTPASALIDGVRAAEGDMTYVACISGDTLNVRDESLNKVLFTASRFEVIKPVQSFGTDAIEKTIDGKVYSFVKVQVPSRGADQAIGWIANEYLKLRSECPGAVVAPPSSGNPQVTATWNFPTIQRTTTSYKEGMRRFKAGRSGGRWHAACDLYRKTNEAAQAVTAGQVIRNAYYFYQGTYALEIRHSDGKVVRYGEITGKAAPGVSGGANVKIGQTIGYIGKVNSNCCEPMLHFEMYSGKGSGPLTTSGNNFSRRSDLMDPSAYLTEWEKAKFGTSY